MAGVFKLVLLFAIVYIGIMAFMSANSIVKQTAPYDANDTLLANQTNQTNGFVDLGFSLAPGILILVAGFVVIKALGGAN